MLRKTNMPTPKVLEWSALNQSTSDCINQFLSAIDTPRALTVWLLYKYEEHDQLAHLDIRISDYIDKWVFRSDYTATCFLSKSDFLKTTFDRKAVALKKFNQCEEACRAVNSRFGRLHSDPKFSGPNVWLLNATIRKIANILGDFNGDEFFDSANWGPGVTTKLKGSYVSGVNKFHLENGITQDLYSLVGDLFKIAYPTWFGHISHLYGSEKPFAIVAGNTLCTVPKSSKTDRVIAVEPGINLWFQKSCGNMIRRRLLRVGVDLNSQEDNQRWAHFASKDDRWATVDFSSASDSISRAVVEMLLPPRWFLLLDSCRSKLVVEGCTPRMLEKFSSMGNGFTFELESLIFYCAAQACNEYLGEPSTCSVFGDDVIIPSSSFNLFSEFSEFLGFAVNREKSFSHGHFRESCGAHYFAGLDVKPFFFKKRLVKIHSVFRFANGVRLLSHRWLNGLGCDRRFLLTFRFATKLVPKALRFQVPNQLGDTGFVSNFDEACPSRLRYGHYGYRVKSLVSIGVTDYLDSPAVLLQALWSPSKLEWRNTYTLRGRVRHRIKTVSVWQWYNLGSWY